MKIITYILSSLLVIATIMLIMSVGYGMGNEEGKKTGIAEQKLADNLKIKELQNQLNALYYPESTDITRDEDYSFELLKDLLDNASSVKVDLSLNSLGENHGTITIVFGEDNK